MNKILRESEIGVRATSASIPLTATDHSTEAESFAEVRRIGLGLWWMIERTCGGALVTVEDAESMVRSQALRRTIDGAASKSKPIPLICGADDADKE